MPPAPHQPTLDSELLAADSFRVRLNPVSGRAEVRGLQLHLERFAAAVAQASAISAAAIEHFFAEALPSIAASGEGFPRLELRAASARSAGGLQLQLRPLPQLTETLRVQAVPYVRIAHRERKGPNIGWYSQLNQEVGAEALLLDEQGNVLEGATTSLMWWKRDTHLRKEHDLHVVNSSRRVRSVTELLVSEQFARMHASTPLAHTASVADLLQHEVWAVNALHGIRVVTEIDGIALPQANTVRLTHFRNALEDTWQPVVE